MAGRAPRILLSAGEPSGDLHGGPLVAALRQRWPEAELVAFGGPRMAEAGARVLWRMEQYSAFGFAEVLGSIPKHIGLMREMEALLDRDRFDLVIPIDYPGFNLRLAERAKRRGVKVLYFIPPAVWAWHSSRVEKLRRFCDRLAVILPFEEPYYRTHGIEARYVGNPLVDRPWPTREEARRRLGVEGAGRVVGIFPGSRGQEIRRLWPPMRDAARTLIARGLAAGAVVAGTERGEYPEAEGIMVHRGDPLDVFVSADVALAKSGTTTLECALAGVPMVVGYKAHWLTAWMARRLTEVPYVAQPNLILDRMAFPELLQEECTAATLVAQAAPLLDPSNPAAAAQRTALAEVRAKVGGPGAARRAAELAMELLGA
ncbi:MAG: lipid-A-disaccharide synthase [Gemmatimonadetes bacterium]|nr:lipid-A-disaccharide synthase [Gemmatimonadota bacterium]